MSSLDDTASMQGTGGWTDTSPPVECASSFDPKSILARAVRSEVVSRLRADKAGHSIHEEAEMIFGPEQRSDFLAAILSEDRGAFDEAVIALDLRSAPFSQTLRELITPVLDDLGQMWRDDSASFMDVTLATCRVQTFVCEKLVATTKRDRGDELHGTIVFARAEGETHTLGLTVVTECFRIDGWNVMGGIDMEIGEGLWAMLAETSVDVLGLTVGSAVQIPAVAEAMRKAREVSLNPDLVIGIGGYCAIADPEAVHGLNADFVATDALDAIDTAASLLGGRKPV